jgi:hypothetical protein
LDSVYDAKPLKEGLIEGFGSTVRMFDYTPTLPSGYKMAVIATTTSKASPVVFSNYNGTGIRSESCGKWRRISLNFANAQ